MAMGRPRIPIDWEQVDKLCGIQCTAEEIALVLGISADTLARACQRTHKMTFADYFAQKCGAGRASLRRAQFQVAIRGNPTMLIWLGKQYLGQSDKRQHEFSGPDGKPIETKAVGDLPDQEIEARIGTIIGIAPEENEPGTED